MNILSQPEVLALLNAAPGVTVSRSTFKQSIRPQMELRGDAQRMGAGNRATWVYDPVRISEWAEYAAVRAELIRRGEWNSKRRYDAVECDTIAQGNAHDDVLRELYPDVPQAV